MGRMLLEFGPPFGKVNVRATSPPSKSGSRLEFAWQLIRETRRLGNLSLPFEWAAVLRREHQKKNLFLLLGKVMQIN